LPPRSGSRGQIEDALGDAVLDQGRQPPGDHVNRVTGIDPQELMNDGPVVSLMVLILAAVQVPVLIWRRGAAAGGPYLHSRIRSALSPDILLAMA